MRDDTVESILAGIRGPVDRGWCNTVVLYLPATDDEKAAALDAAIEFEDQLGERTCDGGRNDDRTKRVR